MNKEIILKQAQGCLPDLLALYAFGSCIQGYASAESDLDLAGDLTSVTGFVVDLLDLRTASTSHAGKPHPTGLPSYSRSVCLSVNRNTAYTKFGICPGMPFLYYPKTFTKPA